MINIIRKYVTLPPEKEMALIAELSMYRPRQSLTPRQLEMYNAVIEYQVKHGYNPRYIDLAKKLNRRLATVYEMARRITEKGYFSQTYGTARGIVIIP